MYTYGKAAETTMERRVISELEAPDKDSTPPVDFVFSANLTGTVVWNPEELRTHLTDLYEIAKEKSWNPSRDIDWHFCSRFDQFPILGDSNPLTGFDEFESLTDPDKKRVAWWQH